MAPFLGKIISMGLPYLADKLMDKGAEEAEEYIEKKIGVKLDLRGDNAPSNDDFSKMREFELSLKAEEDSRSHIREMERMKRENTSDARDMYELKSTMADKIANDVMQRNLPIVAFLVVVNVVAIYFLKDDAVLIAMISNVIGIVIGALINERQAVMNFFFGSSKGSKEKTEIMGRQAYEKGLL